MRLNTNCRKILLALFYLSLNAGGEVLYFVLFARMVNTKEALVIQEASNVDFCQHASDSFKRDTNFPSTVETNVVVAILSLLQFVFTYFLVIGYFALSRNERIRQNRLATDTPANEQLSVVSHSSGLSQPSHRVSSAHKYIIPSFIFICVLLFPGFILGINTRFIDNLSISFCPKQMAESAEDNVVLGITVDSMLILLSMLIALNNGITAFVTYMFLKCGFFRIDTPAEENGHNADSRHDDHDSRGAFVAAACCCLCND